MPFPGEGPFDRIFRSVFDDDDDFRDGGMFPGLPQHAGMPRQSGYHVHQDEKEIQVDVDLPGVAAKDVQVQVWDRTPTCVVQWSGERAVRRPAGGVDSPTSNRRGSGNVQFANRIRLGPSVDCSQLAANLSRGVLRLTAPLKEKQEASNGPRSIHISTNAD